MTTAAAPDLGKDSIPRLLLTFAIPAIVGLMINALYNIVDRIFVGNGVGAMGLAGIAVSFPSFIIMMAFGMMVGVGGSVNFAIRLGQGKVAVAERILANSLVLIVILTVILVAVQLAFLEDVLRFFGATETIMPYAKSYVGITLLGSIFLTANMTMNNFIRASGFPRIAMGTMIIGAISNTILDPIYIFVFHWGVKGAAVAVTGEDHAFLEQVTFLLGHIDGHPSGQGHVARAAAQVLAGHVHGGKRAGAGRLHAQAGPVQVQLVGDARAQVILVVAHQALEGFGTVPGFQAAARMFQIGTDAAACKNADALAFQPAAGQGRISGVLQRFPGAFQEGALLGVDFFRLAAGIAEKGCVEFVDVPQAVGRRDVVRVAQQAVIHARCGKVFPVQEGHADLAFAKVAPVSVEVGSTGKTAAHADDGDRFVSDVHAVHECRSKLRRSHAFWMPEHSLHSLLQHLCR